MNISKKPLGEVTSQVCCMELEDAVRLDDDVIMGLTHAQF